MKTRDGTGPSGTSARDRDHALEKEARRRLDEHGRSHHKKQKLQGHAVAPPDYVVDQILGRPGHHKSRYTVDYYEYESHKQQAAAGPDDRFEHVPDAAEGGLFVVFPGTQRASGGFFQWGPLKAHF